jgi:hypothetical protein
MTITHSARNYCSASRQQPNTSSKEKGFSEKRAGYPASEPMALQDLRIDPLTGSSDGYAASESVVFLLTTLYYVML